MWLDKDELKLAYSYIERMMFESDENFEYYHDLQMFAHKCFIVLKKQKNCRIGLAVCKGDVVDFYSTLNTNSVLVQRFYLKQT